MLKKAAWAKAKRASERVERTLNLASRRIHRGVTRQAFREARHWMDIWSRAHASARETMGDRSLGTARRAHKAAWYAATKAYEELPRPRDRARLSSSLRDFDRELRNVEALLRRAEARRRLGSSSEFGIPFT